MRFLGLISSSSSFSTEGRFKLSASFVAFVANSFDELFTVSVASPVLPSLDSVSLPDPTDVPSTDALVDAFEDGCETDWLDVSGFSSVSTVFLQLKNRCKEK